MSVLVNKQAPDFTAAAVLGDGSIVDAFQLSSLRGKYVVLFFWPLDFTFVCPSEIIAHNNRMDKFRELGVEVVGVSIDSQFTHHAWRSTPVEKGGIGAVEFTMVADVKHEITRAYGIEHEDGVALRASFLIDRAGVVQHQVVNNLPLGREVDEMVGPAVHRGTRRGLPGRLAQGPERHEGERRGRGLVPGRERRGTVIPMPGAKCARPTFSRGDRSFQAFPMCFGGPVFIRADADVGRSPTRCPIPSATPE